MKALDQENPAHSSAKYEEALSDLKAIQDDLNSLRENVIHEKEALKTFQRLSHFASCILHRHSHPEECGFQMGNGKLCQAKKRSELGFCRRHQEKGEEPLFHQFLFFSLNHEKETSGQEWIETSIADQLTRALSFPSAMSQAQKKIETVRAYLSSF